MSEKSTIQHYSFPAQAIQERMRQVLLTDSPQINSVINYLLQTNGKMLRPRLVHLTASLHAHNEDVVRDVAVAVELIHLASLIHDDIIDHSYTRRGKESLNSMWGNETSVLTGDYLFATAFNLINRHNLPLILENITETIQIMCSGEIKQLTMLYDYNISEEDYYDKTYKKTACLFASSCKVGALASNMSAYEVSILEQYGLCVGYAFQLIDDILDFTSDATLLGKTTGNDLIQGNITLPVIMALKDLEVGISLRSILDQDGITLDSLPQVIKLIEDTDAITESLRRARVFLQSGLNIIAELPESMVQNQLRDLSIYIFNDYYRKLNKNRVTEDLECQQLLS
ncbi:MAG TPA: polyprenyl synthetase family protein [Syntrophomonadaceae bacterium]|nr:polyprenyl synthetase family protein [Syntrophomonadaceae bacterium]